jgi:hypothetical protein
MPRDEKEIYCPKCRWRPGAEDRWSCESACGTVWNTFWTRGLCPGCGKQWADTQCLACQQFSPHRQWYHTPEGVEGGRRRKREHDTVT